MATAGNKMGILRELEVNRLRAHGPATLKTTRQLCTELIALKILPGCTADMLRTFMDDIDYAKEQSNAVAPTISQTRITT